MATLLHSLLARLDALRTLARFRLRTLRQVLSMHPIAGGAPEDDADAEAEDKPPNDKPAADADKEDDDGEDDADDDKPADGDKPAEPDWKRMARKHEREAKKQRTENAALAKQLKEREDADKSEQQKALEEATAAARAEEQGKFEKERRQDRLELATTKIAAKGLKIGSGDDAKTVRFADPDDALLHLERDIRNGELDTDEIFDKDGRVRDDQLTEALTDLLSRKPHLAASDGKPAKVQGGADGGKGEPSDTDSSVEDELKKIRRNREGQQQESRVVTRRQ